MLAPDQEGSTPMPARDARARELHTPITSVTCDHKSVTDVTKSVTPHAWIGTAEDAALTRPSQASQASQASSHMRHMTRVLVSRRQAVGDLAVGVLFVHLAS